MSGIENRGLVVAGIGAGSLDYFLPIPENPADVWPGHIPGSKGLLTPNETALLERPNRFERHIGGNVVNILGKAACDPGVELAELMTTLGIDDTASLAIARHLPTLGIDDRRVLRVPGYLPSIAAIEHEHKGSDRMVRSRPRGEMSKHMTDEYLREGLAGKDLIVTASLKDTKLMRRVLEIAPESAVITTNPSMTEINNPDDRASILQSLREFKPVLALNDEEIYKLFGREIESMDLATASEYVSKHYANYVALTNGKEGVFMAHDGESVFAPGKHVPKEKIGTTLGAGDRAHAIAALRIAQEVDLQEIAEEITVEAAKVVQVNGAHQDLYDKAR